MLKKNRPWIALLLGTLLLGCADKTPKPDPPRREAAPPPPRTDPPPRAEPRPAEVRLTLPTCLLVSPSKQYCVRRMENTLPGCNGPHCLRWVYQVFKGDQVVQDVDVRHGSQLVHLTDSGVLLVNPRHAIVGPKAVLLHVAEAGKVAPILAGDVLAPSRFGSEKPIPAEVRGRELHVVLGPGQSVAIDLDTQKAKTQDVHCQVMDKSWVVVSRATPGATGPTATGKGTCDKHVETWSITTPQAAIALSRDGKRLITRNPDPFRDRSAGLVTIWQQQGKSGTAVRTLRLPDLASVTERLPPETCQGIDCRRSTTFEFGAGGQLTLKFPSGKERKVDLLSPALLKPARDGWAFGPRPTAKGAAGNPWMGDPNGKAVIQIFGSLQCPYTAMTLDILRDLLRVQPKGVKVVWMDFWITYHKEARPAALAARSVMAQKGAAAFFAFIGQVLSNLREITPENLLAWAKAAGANPEKVKADVAAETYKAGLEADVAEAGKLGVHGTPQLYLNGTRAGHAGGFWAIRKQLEPVLGKALRPVR